MRRVVFAWRGMLCESLPRVLAPRVFSASSLAWEPDRYLGSLLWSGRHACRPVVKHLESRAASQSVESAKNTREMVDNVVQEQGGTITLSTAFFKCNEGAMLKLTLW